MSDASIWARVRPVFFWLHLAVGVTAGAVILVLSVTGALLGFERQLATAIDDAPRVTVPAGATRLPLDTLLARADANVSAGAIISMDRSAEVPVLVRYASRVRSDVRIDPYSGRALPQRAGGRTQAFFQRLREWHRFVGQANGRGWGRVATGAANLLFLGLVLSGLSLWWPNRWSRAIVRAQLVPAFRLRPKAREFNWHHVAGIWMAMPLMLVVGSGVFMSYEWPTLALDRISGKAATASVATSQPPGLPTPRRRPGAAVDSTVGGATTAMTPRAAFEPMLALAVAKRPDWKSIVILAPPPTGRTVSVTLASGNTFRPDLRTAVELDARSGAILSVVDYRDLPLARRIRGWVRFTHTGEVAGLGGQALATLASLAGVLLVYTGIALALRRMAAWRRTRSAGSVGAA